MTRNDVPILTNQDRVGEPERADTAGDFSNLRAIMGTRIARRRHKPIDRPILEPQAIERAVAMSVTYFVHLTAGSQLPPHPEFRGTFSSLVFPRDGQKK